MDGTSGDIVGHVKSFPGVTHGIAVVTASNRGYTDEGEAGKAASFNLKTFAVEKHIQAAEGADAITFDPVSNHVFIMNGDAGSITVIDPKTDAAVATIDVGGKLEVRRSRRKRQVVCQRRRQARGRQHRYGNQQDCRALAGPGLRKPARSGH